MESTQAQPDGRVLKYYRRADSLEMEVAKEKILEILEGGIDNEHLTKDEFEAMDPRDKDLGKFFAMFKVYKEHQEGNPPQRD